MPNYLYNGVELPAFPEWNKSENPYVVLCHYIPSDTYYLYIGRGRPFYSTGDTSGINKGSNFFAIASACYDLEDGTWVLKYSYINQLAGISLDSGNTSIIYTNADVLNDSGAVYIAAGTTTDPNMPTQPADPVLPIPRGVTHCWYNDKKFAVLTEWDIRVYPYVFLCDRALGVDEVIASRYPLKYKESAHGGLHINNHYETNEDSWGPWSVPGISGTENGTQIWANYDMYDGNGVLQLAASALVPDGEPVPDPDEPDTSESFVTFSSKDAFTIATYNATKNWDGTLYYSTNAAAWNEWDGTSAIASAQHGVDQRIYMRGIGNTKVTGGGANSKKQRWLLTGNNIYCNGNIESLLDYKTVLSGEHPAMAVYCYAYMFYGCTSIVSSPELPAPTLTVNCYWRMFASCSSLTKAPKLPATTLANSCYYDMFSGCASLETLPVLPATTLANSCYFGMFYGCSKIKLSSTKNDSYQTEYRIPANGKGTVGTDSLANMFNNTGGTFASTPAINTTYYTSNQVVNDEPDMPEFAIIPTSDYKEACDFIRSKSGKTEPIVSGNLRAEIEGIAGDHSIEDKLIEGTITEYQNDRISNIGKYAFSGRKKLSRVIMPNVTDIDEFAFHLCESLEYLDVLKVRNIGQHAFSNCTKINNIYLPLLEKVNMYIFHMCSNLKKVDLPSATFISGQAFAGCYVLNTLILRSENMVQLQNQYVFMYSALEDGAGYIYVPRALVDTYRTADYWNAFENQFRALEDYTVDGTITGELDPNKI